MNIVLVWIQWSGKWTQARFIQDKFGYHFFEMWQKLRNFSSLDNPDSLEVKKCIDSWQLVPIELSWKILAHYRQTHSDNFIIFDGIPRSLDQKEMFDLIINEYVVFYLDLDKNEAIKRLSWRRIDPATWETFSSEYTWETNPKTWNKLVIRDDDKPESVKKRIEIFYANTMPLLASWAHDWRKIYSIDASWDVEKVFLRISEIIWNEFYTSVE